MLSASILRTHLLPIAVALLLCSGLSFAFPLKNELPAFNQDIVAKGYARVAGDSAVRYIETYLDEPTDERTIRASYWTPDQRLIAYKKLDFSKNPMVPDLFEVIDYRRSIGYRVTVKSNIANVVALKLLQNGSAKKLSNNNVEIGDSTIIDASFHRFIIANWDELLSGKTFKVKFLQIDKSRLVPLKIKKRKCDTPGTACFKISLDNFLLQGIVPNIFMKYEINTQRLLRFTGLGPITKMNGKGLPVDIMYEYLQ